MGKTPDIGDKAVQPVDTVKIMSQAGMSALIEEHADFWGGAGRLSELLDYATDAKTWNYLGSLLSLDLCDGAH